MELDITEAIPNLDSYDPIKEKRYEQAQLLVKVLQRPVAMLQLALPISAHDLAKTIWLNCRDAINEYLISLGFSPIDQLTEKGLGRDKPELETEANELISVLVATRDRTDYLAACLESLTCQSYTNYEIIVIDNAPTTDASKRYIEQHYPDSAVRYICEPQPGLAIAHNSGLRVAQGEFIAITDDDVIVDKHWLWHLREAFDRAPEVACVTGLVLPIELETPAQYWLEQYGGFSRGFQERLFDLRDHRLPDVLYPYAAGSYGAGANMAYRSSTLCQMGGFDPALGAGSKGVGGDDLAIFFDVISQGHTIAYTPAAYLYHRHRRDYEGLRRQAFGYGVGLTAYLTKIVMDKPVRLLDMLWRAPAGFRHIFDPQSKKNRHKQADYPKELTWLERYGMLFGPWAYISGRLANRKLATAQQRADFFALTAQQGDESA